MVSYGTDLAPPGTRVQALRAGNCLRALLAGKCLRAPLAGNCLRVAGDCIHGLGVVDEKDGVVLSEHLEGIFGGVTHGVVMA